MASRWIRWPEPLATTAPTPRGPIAYGGDYNPEQWSRDVWLDDARLMQEAGVNLVSIAIFSWARIQPAPDVWDFEWLDTVIEILHAHGVAVDLATATASPPPWLTTLHPEMLPVDVDGHTLFHGSRQSWSPSSPVYREHSLALVEKMAERYGAHPALAMWHVSNELGCHNALDYSDVAAAAFRTWLEARYGTLDELNRAWGTDFWSQRYTAWGEVLPPRRSTSFANPTAQLDFARFSSHQLREQLRAEREVLTRITPDVPVTTNFMVMGETRNMDYASWAGDVDLVSNDHYVWSADPESHVELSFSADLTHGIAGGEPWMLMEHSTSAVNWQHVNLAKRPGQLRRNSLAHVAHGADAVCYFQWRQSAAGAEKFHSAMVPHAGTDSALWRSVVSLGADLVSLGEVAGSSVHADVAVLFDWESWWASELDSHPSNAFRYRRGALDWYRTLFAAQVGTAVLPADAPLDGYRLVVVPHLYLADEAVVARLTAFAEAGGSVLVTYFSGIADTDDHIHLGGYPGAFRDLLGVRVEEFAPVLPGDVVHLEASGPLGAGRVLAGSGWTEPVGLVGAESVASYTDGPSAGWAGITRAARGTGAAWYVSTDLDDEGRTALATALLAEAGVHPLAEAGTGVELVERRSPEGARFLFAINHTDTDTHVAASGTDLLTGTTHDGTVPVGAGDVVVLRLGDAG
ncbi:beta-galactosidase [Sanguibacter suaedae]|uniref:Beta-galactosidase n=1 Tax=Sanguibacter suaedae TaxID=2795737 RepID=A0A934IBJ1_9MICO|nr:beta-galactosidase [Sanguibacter suaedae]MBI9113859.1 beta-galactosidase [Sanguibacter suaedae]